MTEYSAPAGMGSATCRVRQREGEGEVERSEGGGDRGYEPSLLVARRYRPFARWYIFSRCTGIRLADSRYRLGGDVRCILRTTKNGPKCLGYVGNQKWQLTQESQRPIPRTKSLGALWGDFFFSDFKLKVQDTPVAIDGTVESFSITIIGTYLPSLHIPQPKPLSNQPYNGHKERTSRE